MSDQGQPLFAQATLIGIGLIGSSLARGMKASGAVGQLVIHDADPGILAEAEALGLGDRYEAAAGVAVAGADLVILCTPLGAYAAVGAAISASLKPGAIVSDVGSVKQTALTDLAPHIPAGVHLVPGHPIAGTEHSGPASGFAELFFDRWVVLTPPSGADADAVAAVTALWQRLGSMVEIMDATHHDKVLAITSHLPHLIAYTIVGTATDLEADTQAEVVRFSASGFRDFTRIAASDPTMWRDVFLANKEAVLEMLQRFSEDLTALQRAIRWGEGDVLFDLFTRTRAVRREIIDARQDQPEWVKQKDGGAE
ncbi:MAG: prephenate/arogenate dehydrogenase family protein [Magnetospiraceae bacterium]